MSPQSLNMHHLMHLFCTIAEKGSFTEAARVLGIKTSSASKGIAKLESALATKLIARTTRSLFLTEQGRYFYRKSLALLDQTNALLEDLRHQGSRPTGTLKITTTVALGEHFIGPLIPEFMAHYPEVKLALDFSDSILDFAENEIDIAIRSLRYLSDSSMYRLALAPQHRRLVATPEYLAKHGIPETPPDLEAHRAAVFRNSGRFYNRWSLLKGKKKHRCIMRFNFSSNNYSSVLQAVRGSQGIGNLFDYMVRDDLNSGSLTALLEDYRQEPQNIVALYHQKRALSPKIDVFLAFLEARFKPQTPPPTHLEPPLSNRRATLAL